jgi:ubiquinone/menaquinone biosynthesis C-methylase UbiE
MKIKGLKNNLSSAKLRRHYDERFARRPLRAREGFYAWIAGRIPPEQDSKVLDIACGGGYLLKRLQGRGCELFGSDISAQALRIAGNEAPEAKFVLADAEKLPFPDASFDMIYNLGSLEHFLDMDTALREMHRIMRPDAKLIVMVPNSRYIGDLWRKLTFRGGADHHQILERFGTLKEWKALLESGGFKVQSVFPYNKFKLRLRFVPLNFAYCFVFICVPA